MESAPTQQKQQMEILFETLQALDLTSHRNQGRNGIIAAAMELGGLVAIYQLGISAGARKKEAILIRDSTNALMSIVQAARHGGKPSHLVWEELDSIRLIVQTQCLQQMEIE